ncbi:MAG: hypothetical protein O2856_05360 [Planctomycetota bacterium]|nr:hypothetical protein [Planctomycetota bacterium]
MDAEDSPAAGLRNGLRSAVGFVFRFTHDSSNDACIILRVGTWMQLTKIPSLFVSSAPMPSDSTHVESLGVLLRSATQQAPLSFPASLNSVDYFTTSDFNS